MEKSARKSNECSRQIVGGDDRDYLVSDTPFHGILSKIAKIFVRPPLPTKIAAQKVPSVEAPSVISGMGESLGISQTCSYPLIYFWKQINEKLTKFPFFLSKK